MDTLKRLIYLLVPTCFLFGLWWGLKEYRSKNHPNIQYSKSLNVLTPAGVIPKVVKEQFERNFEIGLRIKEVPSAKELIYQLRNPAKVYDVIFIFSDQLSIKQTKELFKINPVTRKKRLQSLSSDFQWSPADPELSYLLPLFWGINGVFIKKSHREKFKLSDDPTWKEINESLSEKRKVQIEKNAKTILDFLEKAGKIKSEWLETEQADFARQPLRESLKHIQLVDTPRKDFKKDSFFKPSDEIVAIIGDQKAYKLDESNWEYILPRDKSSLWLLFAGVSQLTPLENESKSFLEFLLRKKMAFLMTQYFYGSSTLRTIDKENLDSKKKSEFLREIPLTKVEVTEGFGTGLILWERLLDSLTTDSETTD